MSDDPAIDRRFRWPEPPPRRARSEAGASGPQGGQTVEMRAGDGGAVDLVLADEDGSLVPLRGDEAVRFTWETLSGEEVTARPGLVVEAAASRVRCVMLGPETAGRRGQVLLGRARVSFADGTVETFPTRRDGLLLALS